MKDDGSIRTVGDRVTPFGLDVEDALAILERTKAEVLAGKIGWLGICAVPPLEQLFHSKTKICWNRWTTHHTALIGTIAGAISIMHADFLSTCSGPETVVSSEEELDD